MSKKLALKDLDNIYRDFYQEYGSDEFTGNSQVEVELGTPAEWSENTEWIVEYKPVAIYRVIPEVPASFKKETK